MKLKLNKLLLFLLSIFTSVVVSQKKHCETPPVEDLMTITKCAVKVKKKKGAEKRRELSVRVVARRAKIIRKNEKAVALNYDGSSRGVNDVGKKNEVLKLSKSELVRTLSRKISAAEIAQSIPLSAVKNIPLFPRCLNRSKNDKRMECFSQELSKHIQRHLEYPREAVINKIEGDVWVRFIINKKGQVTNIEARGPQGGAMLEMEAKTVIANLPKFKPGMYNGKPINVKYAFPVNFKLDEIE